MGGSADLVSADHPSRRPFPPPAPAVHPLCYEKKNAIQQRVNNCSPSGERGTSEHEGLPKRGNQAVEQRPHENDPQWAFRALEGGNDQLKVPQMLSRRLRGTVTLGDLPILIRM